MRRVADAIAETLRANDVDIFFMLTGGDPALWTALQSNNIRMVSCRSEQGAAYMADGYARITGKPTFVYGQHGPGSANVASALADAHWAMSPVVSLTSSVPAATRDRYEYQLLDQLAMHVPVTRWAAEAREGSHVVSMLLRAMHEATSGAGPAHLDVPRDVIGSALPDSDTSVSPTRYRNPTVPTHRPVPDPVTLDAIWSALSLAKRPVIIAGSGAMVSRAYPEIGQFAEILGAPVVTSIGGKGIIADGHNLAAGVIGRYAGAPSNAILREADVVLILGSRLNSVTSNDFTLVKPQSVIAIDMNHLSLNPSYWYGAVGDVKATVAQLLERASAHVADTDAVWLDSVRSRISDWRKDALNVPGGHAPTAELDPREVISEVRDSLRPTDIVVADTGYMAAWAGVLYPVREAGPYFMRAAGSLGWAIPGAMGAALASPSKRVVCIIGDGGAGYNLAELETAVRVGIPVTIVIMNNRKLAFEYHLQKYVEKNVIPEINDFTDIDYGAVARSFGAEGYLVRNREQLREALDASASHHGPTLIDVRINPEAIAPVMSYAKSDIKV